MRENSWPTARRGERVARRFLAATTWAGRVQRSCSKPKLQPNELKIVDLECCASENERSYDDGGSVGPEVCHSKQSASTRRRLYSCLFRLLRSRIDFNQCLPKT